MSDFVEYDVVDIVIDAGVVTTLVALTFEIYEDLDEDVGSSSSQPHMFASSTSRIIVFE